MKKLCSLLVSASIICALQGYAADMHWGYTGASSPEKWGDLDAKYATCKTGKYQSPIDITTAAPTIVESIAFNYRAAPLKIVNNGHTIQVNTKIAPQLIVVSTPPLNKTFEHMRGPPTLLGWCPTRRRYVQ